MYRKSGNPQPRSNRQGPGIPLPKYGPGDYVRIEIILGGGKQRRSGCVLITATMSIRSSSGLLMMIVLIDLAKRSQQDRSWRRASIEYEKAEPQHVDSAMPSDTRNHQVAGLLGTIQTLKVDTALLPRTCHICQF